MGVWFIGIMLVLVGHVLVMFCTFVGHDLGKFRDSSACIELGNYVLGRFVASAGNQLGTLLSFTTGARHTHRLRSGSLCYGFN